jgi:predicted dehydrogenase
MVRFGIVGFGLHAVKRLMPGFAAARDCRVVALTKRDRAAARTAADRYGIAHVFTSTSGLCACSEVDAVLVSSPDALHLPDVLTALEAGRPVLCEKPLALDAAQARRMVAAAGTAGVPLGVAHVFRFEESVRLFRRLVAEGVIGAPAHGRAEFIYPAYESPRSWIRDPGLAAGGPLADVGIHCIDTLRYVLGDEIVEVSTLGRTAPDTGPFETGAVLSLKFARGSLGTVEVAGDGPYRTALEVSGTGGSLQARDALNVERPLNVTLERGSGDGSPRTWEVDNRLAYTRQVESFARMVEGEGDFEVPGEEGLRNQLVLEAAYRSLRSGHLERVEEV